MLYTLAHIMQRKIPFLWNVIEQINDFLFVLRYGRKIRNISSVLSSHSEFEYEVREARPEDVESLVAFFLNQPDVSYQYFKPHLFDARTIEKLIRRWSYLFFIVLDEGQIIGYYFLRCFFSGRSYVGLIVDKEYRGKGIGDFMYFSSMEIACSMGLAMYVSISDKNPASLHSVQKRLVLEPVGEMEDAHLYRVRFHTIHTK